MVRRATKSLSTDLDKNDSGVLAYPANPICAQKERQDKLVLTLPLKPSIRSQPQRETQVVLQGTRKTA